MNLWNFRNGAVSLTAVDPGGTTGIGMYDAEYLEGTFFNQRFQQLEIGPEDHHDELLALLERRQTHNTVVICESFDNRDNPAAELISLEYIGVCKLFGQQRHVPVVFQTPALGKGFWDDGKLKRASLYNPTKGGHQNDAMRHLLHYMVHELGRKDLLEVLR